MLDVFTKWHNILQDNNFFQICLQIDDAGSFFRFLSKRQFLHSQKITYWIKVISITVLLPNFFLYKLIPIIDWKWPKINNLFIFINFKMFSIQYFKINYEEPIIFKLFNLLSWNNKFVPMWFNVIIFRLLSNPKSIKLQTPSNFLLSFKYSQRNLK